MKRCLLIWLCGMTFLTTIHAQRLQVSLPIDGAIYQQNDQHQGKIIVRGDLNTRNMLIGGYAVSATLRKLDLVSGNPTGTAPIDIPVSRNKTIFSGSKVVEKGWYELTVRATQITTFPLIRRNYESKRKVGVGEVFIIAGQSNAQGGFGVAPSTQLMDAVRVSPDLIPLSKYPDPTDLPESYRKIQNLRSTANSSVIGPLGSDLWYWGSVGAKVALDCDAPVAMFNAAY